jgi:hypothetical protein
MYSRHLDDCDKDLFDAVMFDDPSRFNRDPVTNDRAINIYLKNGIRFFIGSMELDLDDPDHVYTVDSNAAFNKRMAAHLRKITVRGKLKNAKKAARGECKVPAGPKRQVFGREHVYDKKSGKWIWELKKKEPKAARWAAAEILNGRGTVEVSNIVIKRYGLPLSHNYLRKVLTERCGDEWIFMGVKFKIPRILDEATIAALKERFKRNKQFNRTDVKKENLLNEVTRCARCNRAIQGWTDKKTYKGRITVYERYSHPTGSQIECDCRFNFRKQKLEDFIFDMLWEFAWDRVGFYKAVEDQVPDQKGIETLKKTIAQNEKELKKVGSKIDRLVDAYTDDKMNAEIYSKKETELLEIRDTINSELKMQRAKLNRLPDIEKLMAGAKKMRRQLLEYYSSPERLRDMSYDEKRALLNYFFSGRDENGKKFGIEIDKNDQGELTISMYGAYMFLKQRKKGSPVGMKFEMQNKLGDTDYNYPILHRIFDSKTLPLNRGQTCCREFITSIWDMKRMS